MAAHVGQNRDAEYEDLVNDFRSRPCHRTPSTSSAQLREHSVGGCSSLLVARTEKHRLEVDHPHFPAGLAAQSFSREAAWCRAAAAAPRISSPGGGPSPGSHATRHPPATMGGRGVEPACEEIYWRWLLPRGRGLGLPALSRRWGRRGQTCADEQMSSPDATASDGRAGGAERQTAKWEAKSKTC